MGDLSITRLNPNLVNDYGIDSAASKKAICDASAFPTSLSQADQNLLEVFYSVLIADIMIDEYNEMIEGGYASTISATATGIDTLMYDADGDNTVDGGEEWSYNYTYPALYVRLANGLSNPIVRDPLYDISGNRDFIRMNIPTKLDLADQVFGALSTSGTADRDLLEIFYAVLMADIMIDEYNKMIDAGYAGSIPATVSGIDADMYDLNLDGTVDGAEEWSYNYTYAPLYTRLTNGLSVASLRRVLEETSTVRDYAEMETEKKVALADKIKKILLKATDTSYCPPVAPPVHLAASRSTTPECSDGVDNDYDGRIDDQDFACHPAYPYGGYEPTYSAEADDPYGPALRSILIHDRLKLVPEIRLGTIMSPSQRLLLPTHLRPVSETFMPNLSIGARLGSKDDPTYLLGNDIFRSIRKSASPKFDLMVDAHIDYQGNYHKDSTDAHLLDMGVGIRPRFHNQENSLFFFDPEARLDLTIQQYEFSNRHFFNGVYPHGSLDLGVGSLFGTHKKDDWLMARVHAGIEGGNVHYGQSTGWFSDGEESFGIPFTANTTAFRWGLEANFSPSSHILKTFHQQDLDGVDLSNELRAIPDVAISLSGTPRKAGLTEVAEYPTSEDSTIGSFELTGKTNFEFGLAWNSSSWRPFIDLSVSKFWQEGRSEMIAFELSGGIYPNHELRTPDFTALHNIGRLQVGIQYLQNPTLYYGNAIREDAPSRDKILCVPWIKWDHSSGVSAQVMINVYNFDAPDQEDGRGSIGMFSLMIGLRPFELVSYIENRR